MVRVDDRRLLLVHAHPDDEATTTGATMAHYAHQGATVVLVTCTRGEVGEIVAPELAGLRDTGPDGLARHRETELAEALAALGTTRHHWLGGRGRWQDSGLPANGNAATFARAEPAEAVRALVEILRAERPQVVVTYDADGGYGHPDHIQANRVTMAVVDGRQHLDAKVAALRAHRSQVNLENGVFAVLTKIPEFALESYQLVRGDRGPGSGPHNWEADLFAGLDARDIL